MYEKFPEVSKCQFVHFNKTAISSHDRLPIKLHHRIRARTHFGEKVSIPTGILDAGSMFGIPRILPGELLRPGKSKEKSTE